LWFVVFDSGESITCSPHRMRSFHRSIPHRTCLCSNLHKRPWRLLPTQNCSAVQRNRHMQIFSSRLILSDLFQSISVLREATRSRPTLDQAGTFGGGVAGAKTSTGPQVSKSVNSVREPSLYWKSLDPRSACPSTLPLQIVQGAQPQSAVWWVEVCSLVECSQQQASARKLWA